MWWSARALSGRGPQGVRRLEGADEVARALAAMGGRCAQGRQHVQVVSSGSALIVAVVACGDRSEVVAKLATEPRAAEEMRLDSLVRGRIAADSRARGWSALLPEVVHADLEALPAVSVERRRGRVDGRKALAGPPASAAPALRNALDAVAQLHAATATRARADEALLAEWVGEPLAAIGSLYRAGSWQVRSLSRLEGVLAEVLYGTDVLVGWSHGDYSPGNLLFGGPGCTVLEGVVDWGAGSPRGLLGRDTSLLVVSTVMQRLGLDMGEVVTGLLRRPEAVPAWEGLVGPGRWSELERVALRWGSPAPAGQAAPGGRVERQARAATLVLAWAQHVSRNVAKAEAYSRRSAWRVANVDLVLASEALPGRTGARCATAGFGTAPSVQGVRAH